MIFSLLSTRGNSQNVSYINSPIWIAVSRGMLFGISAAGLLAVLSGLVDLTDSGGDTAFFLIFGTLATVICAYSARYISGKKLKSQKFFLRLLQAFCFVSCVPRSCIHC